jgi:Family of unknown function (DUF5691)
MNSWETLVASALVGTSRQEPSLDFTHPALADYGASLQSQSASQQILSAAGLITSYQSIGQGVTPANFPLLLPAAAENKPYCADLTSQHLNTIGSESRYLAILPELLQLLAQAGQTVTPDFLPLLLDLGKRDKSLRPLILPILGSRGDWLARQNPSWEYALDIKIEATDAAALQEIWATGTRRERLVALTQWRQIQPSESRQAIVANWKKDKADDREAWLEVLQTNLSLADEEFLEVALFDRSEPVRTKAAYLLNHLPSQYRQRLTKLASNCLTIKEKNNKYRIVIHLPNVGDEEWQKSGINTKYIDRNSGGQTIPEAMLFHAISAADLDIWGGDIDRWVQTASTLQEKNSIFTAWARAASYQQRLDWMEVLLTRSHSFITSTNFSQLLQSFQATDSDRVEQFFTKILTADNFMDNIGEKLEIIMTPVGTKNRKWSKQFSNLLLEQFDRHIHELNNFWCFSSERICNLLGQYLDVSVLPEVRQIQTKLPLGNSNRLDYCIELLEFRRDMRSLFNIPNL